MAKATGFFGRGKKTGQGDSLCYGEGSPLHGNCGVEYDLPPEGEGAGVEYFHYLDYTAQDNFTGQGSGLRTLYFGDQFKGSDH